MSTTATVTRFRIHLGLVVAALLTALAIPALTAAPAHATVTSCGNGQCTVYLSRSETRALSQGRVPAPPAAVPAQLRSAYYALAYGHRWFAGQYANQKKCSAFTLNVRPWVRQGYYGYSCTWN